MLDSFLDEMADKAYYMLMYAQTIDKVNLYIEVLKILQTYSGNANGKISKGVLHIMKSQDLPVDPFLPYIMNTLLKKLLVSMSP